MTAPDPRLDEIQARLSKASIHDGPWAVEEDETWGAKVYVREPGFGTMYICENLTQQEDGRADAEFIAAAPADVSYLLAELRKAREALAKVDLALDAMDAGVAIRSGDPRTKSHTATVIRAAVAAVKGDERG